jgi:hypothetical protein
LRLETPIHIHTAVWRSGLPWLIGLMARRGRLVALGFIALSALNEQLRFLGSDSGEKWDHSKNDRYRLPDILAIWR